MPKSTNTNGSKLVNKSAFVRALPELSADAVIAKGKQAGIKLSKAQVYTIRTNAKRKAAQATSGSAAPARPARAGDARAGDRDASGLACVRGGHYHRRRAAAPRAGGRKARHAGVRICQRG